MIRFVSSSSSFSQPKRVDDVVGKSVNGDRQTCKEGGKGGEWGEVCGYYSYTI